MEKKTKVLKEVPRPVELVTNAGSLIRLLLAAILFGLTLNFVFLAQENRAEERVQEMREEMREETQREARRLERKALTP